MYRTDLNTSLDAGLPNQSCKEELPEGIPLTKHNTSNIKQQVWNLIITKKITCQREIP